MATGRRCHVTVLFSDLCNSTVLGRTTDPEVYDEIIETCKEDAERIVRAHGGVVTQFYGDGVLAVFGFPEPGEDDVRRATEAALQLHQEIPELPLDPLLPPDFVVRLHSGIHSGLAFVREGDATRGVYQVAGDATNTAAALCAGAGAGEIAVSAEALRGNLAFFDTEELAPVALKGGQRAIDAYRILGRSDVKSRFEASARQGLTAFVGRESELRLLDGCWQRARVGDPQVVSIVGDAGVGKTRLAAEFLRRVEAGAGDEVEEDVREDVGEECTVRRGYCEPHGSVGQEIPVVGLIESVVDAEASEPLILFVDDWQWADDASRQALSELIEAARDRALLVLTTSRALDPGDPAMAGGILRIGSFTREEVTRTVDALLPHRAELGLVEWIHEQSGGNPLYIEELCRSLADRVPSEELRSGERLPTLAGLIEARVRRLPRPQADIVRTASVIGTVIPAWLLEELTGHSENEPIVRELALEDLIYGGETPGSLRFKHGRTRDVVYNTVRLKERRALHLQIAAALRNRGRSGSDGQLYERLGHHYFAGADYVQAAEYAELAGDQALATAALDRARHQYQTALQALARQEQTADLRRRTVQISRRWAKACAYSPARDQLAVLGRAVEHAEGLGDTAAVAEAEYWLGWINYALGEQWEAIRHYERALGLARELGDERRETYAVAALGQCYAAVCHYDRALSLLDEAIGRSSGEPVGERRDDAPSSASNPAVALSYPLTCKAVVAADGGDFAAAHELIGRALELLPDPDLAIAGSIRAFQAAILLWQGRWEESLEVSRRAQATAERVSGPYVFAMARVTESYARWHLEESPEQRSAALESLREAAEWLETQEMCLYVSFCYGWVADAMAAAGRDEEARDYAARALDRAKKASTDDHVGEAIAYRVLARVAARSPGGELAEPTHYLAEAMRSARARGSRHEIAVTRLEAAALYGELKQPRKARLRLEQAVRAFEAMDMPWHVGRAEGLARGIPDDR